MVKSALVGSKENIQRVFGPEHLEELKRRTNLYPQVIVSAEIDARIEDMQDVEILVSTWGMPEFTDMQLDRLPNLRLVLYAAGDVRYFADPFVRRGIHIVSAWRPNAVPVAEFTLAHILLAGKSYLRNVDDYRQNADYQTSRRGRGNLGETVAILGAGAVGRAVLELLRPFQLKPVVYDPYLTDADADSLGVAKVTLERAFSEALVVSNHVPNNEETKGMIGVKLLGSMRQGATFINTGRGRTLIEQDLVEVFRGRPDLTAILDVTDPEPVPKESPLWSLSNVFISTHIAGALGNELERLPDLCLEELDRYLNGEPLQHEIPPLSLTP